MKTNSLRVLKESLAHHSPQVSWSRRFLFVRVATFGGPLVIKGHAHPGIAQRLCCPFRALLRAEIERQPRGNQSNGDQKRRQTKPQKPRIPPPTWNRGGRRFGVLWQHPTIITRVRWTTKLPTGTA